MKNVNDGRIPNWIKLDNAATIYPATLSRRYAAMFRVTVTFDKKIDIKILEEALNNVIKRFPSFRYKLKSGLFWCYLKFNKGCPAITKDYKNPLLPINFKENKNFMFRIRVFEKRLAIEIFHAITDGRGGLIFLLTLAGEYLRLKENIKIEYNDVVLNPYEKWKEEEFTNQFKKYARNIKDLGKKWKAFHIKGTNENRNMLNIITGIIPIDKLKKRAKEYDCTITEYIVALLIDSVQDIQEKKVKRPEKREPIIISVPIDLRKVYNCNTLRNFASFINVSVDTKYGHYKLQEIVDEVKCKMKLMFSEKRINAKITSTVRLPENFFIRIIPMFIKKHVMNFSEWLYGDRGCTTVFSNLGNVNLPKTMIPFVEEIGFIIGKSRGKSGSCTCVGYNNKLFMTFSSKIKETDFQRLFFTKLVELGIPVEIESNKGE
ncbi:MAG: hypothetical protein GX951_04875 [Mollicutes bacterium]|nr:hypothetical protein [Mollicutes bacterium]